MKNFDLLLTKNCMFKCKMCYLWQHPEERNELSMSEWESIIRDMVEFQGNSPALLHFGGGEPFSKNGIVSLIKLAKSASFEVKVTSNGFMINDALASEIIDSGLDHISVSLDSLQPEVHDYLRGVLGAHERVMRAIDCLSRKKTSKIPTIGINCLISAVNIDSLLPMAEWVINNEKTSGVIFQAVIQPHDTAPDNFWYEKQSFSALWPKKQEQLDRVLDKLIELKRKGHEKISNTITQLEVFKLYFRNPQELIKKVRCPVDEDSVLINWQGQVFLCGLLEQIGDVHEANLKNILTSPSVQIRSEEMKKCKKNCNNKINCYFKEGSLINED